MAAADTARRLIDKHGWHDGRLTRPSRAQTAPANRPWAPETNGQSALVASDLAVVVLDARTVLKPERILPEQTAVAYLAAGVEPLNLDVLRTRSKGYVVLEVEELAPGPDTCLYILHLKGR